MMTKNIFGDDVNYNCDVMDKYLKYLEEHIANVKKSYNWIIKNAPEVIKLIPDNELKEYKLSEIIAWHDDSKYCTGKDAPYYSLFSEFDEYANYFYGENKDDHTVKNNFNKAWLIHQHVNPHHWQYWVLIQDDEDTQILDMPVTFIIEMFCDHWSFSWKQGDLHEIENWYNNHKHKMIMSEFTRNTYDKILKIVMDKLDDANE